MGPVVSVDASVAAEPFPLISDLGPLIRAIVIGVVSAW